ncbi:MAG TPA: histidinol-phosphatase HisJ family protein, partial [Thermomicrobiaceae bacterium]|nr:histidinol-phosphatase HisJ family protein [Thermomicrobiaceae bacterium]
MAFPQDYHLHTTFSVDGFLTPEELCRRAIEVGTQEIAITDHVDFVEGDISMLKFQPDAFFDALASCRREFEDSGELIIRAGVEIGESNHFEDQVGWLLESYSFDFVIGSLHAASAVFTDEPKDFEDPAYYLAHSVEETYNAYFAELLTLARDGDYDVIGHLDLPKRHSVPAYGPFDPRPFEEPIRAVLQAVIDRGKGIEINTGTARREIGV